MACEVALMTPQVDVQAMDSLYNQATWNQQLSPELTSPVHVPSPLSAGSAVRSPASSVHSPAPLSHAGSPMPASMPRVTCCSPVSANSPNMQAVAHSPIMQGTPVMDNVLSIVKQECLDYNGCSGMDAHHDSLSSLLRNDMIAVQNLSMLPPHMGPPHPREILDGECLLLFFCLKKCDQLLK